MQGTIDLPVSWIINADGYDCTNGEETSRQGWSRLLDFVQNERLLLLRRTRGLFFGIPKAQLTEPQLAELLDILRNAGVRETR